MLDIRFYAISGWMTSGTTLQTLSLIFLSQNLEINWNRSRTHITTNKINFSQCAPPYLIFISESAKVKNNLQVLLIVIVGDFDLYCCEDTTESLNCCYTLLSIAPW